MSRVQKTIEINHHLKNINILVADNDQKIVDLITGVLRYLGFKSVFAAADGFKAVNIMYQHPIDLVITDWELQPIDENYLADLPPNPVLRTERWSPAPPRDGASFVQYLRQSKYSPDPYVPIIMLTGLGLKNNIEYARDAGVNEIILKPISVEKFCDRIAKLIDDPRCFVTAKKYKGPCRRRKDAMISGKNRRKQDVKLIKHN